VKVDNGAVIDQQVTWHKVEERLATETDPLLRANLELLLRHMIAERRWTWKCSFHRVGERRYQNSPPKRRLLVGKRGAEVLRGLRRSGAYKLQLDLDRLVVDALHPHEA